ncbi:MAG: endonuclease MutS2 [Lishizhenia sp.]
MLHIDQQTFKDLEFNYLLEIMGEYCVGKTAHNRIINLKPLKNHTLLKKDLFRLNEFKNIRVEGETFPRIDFEELSVEIRMLPIQNAALQKESFVRLLNASHLVNAVIYFFNKRDEEYPELIALLERVYFTKEIIEPINTVFDKTGEVKDDASPDLFKIRQQLKTVQNQINRNFDREIRKLQKAGVLSDMREAYLDNKRVLSVVSTHKRTISGSVLGSSKTGGLTYIEPEVNVPLNNELELLRDDERKEIFKILKALTKELSGFLPLIEGYNDLLIELDFIQAKTRLALKLDAILPAIEKETRVELIDAYHPVLKLKNEEQKKKTIPQSLVMDKFSRMLVISGPNAGGKSITLKTVGLLQLMLQSGLLIPAHPNSKMCFFQSLLTDIGDNQSIENELSTYSYRLKRMKHFLEVANKKTLLLLDEFGTGSDPDLGGALAEVFFETLYNKKCFGVITTHYANIKLKADKLKNAVNGCMLFNTETLAPLFKLSLGQPGSSFTFEVAQINGIDIDLINEAKNRLDKKKVEMDELLSELQKEKTYLTRLNKEHIEAQEIAQKAKHEFESGKRKFDEKYFAQKELFDTNMKLIAQGKKLRQFIDKYKTKGKGKNVNKVLLEEVKKYIATEKYKIDEGNKAEVMKAKANKPASKKAVSQKQKDHLNHAKIKLGSEVKLLSTKQKGTVEEMNGTLVTVTFGFMRLKVEIDKLMWVK